MTSQPSLFAIPPAPLADICRRKSRGNPHSEAANQRVHPVKLTSREEIFSLIAVARDGITSKEIARKLNKPLHTVSPRLCELKSEGRIAATDGSRDGAAILVVCK
jgi:DNA-binding NarL/FixJ family response regulator